MSKQYGLISMKKDVPGKSNYEATRLKRESKMVIDMALEEDPNIFAYDEIYDDMKKQQNSENSGKQESNNQVKKKSKFIENLKLNAEKRKITEERRIDRKIEKERAAEGDKYADKEVFVTDAYKQKLLERKIYEEVDKREMELEEMLDLKKQEQGLIVFHRNILNQKVGEKVELKPKEKYLDKVTDDLRKQFLNHNKVDKEEEHEKTEFKKLNKNLKSKRQRRSSSSSEEDVVIRDLRKSKERKKDYIEKEAKKYRSEDKKDKNYGEDKKDKNHGEDKKDKNDGEDKIDQRKENFSNKDKKELKDKKENEKTSSDAKKSENDQKIEDNKKSEAKNEPQPIKLTLREILTELFRKKCVGDEFLNQQRQYFERKSNYESR